MKRIKADWRANLNIPSLQRLMFLAIEGPRPEQFNAEMAVHQWWTSSKQGRRPGYTAWDSRSQTVEEETDAQYAVLYDPEPSNAMQPDSVSESINDSDMESGMMDTDPVHINLDLTLSDEEI